MGQRIEVVLTGDLHDGEVADQPRRTRRRAADAGGPVRRSSGGRNGADLSEVRAWARSQGYNVSDRGRISGEVQQAYAAATGG